MESQGSLVLLISVTSWDFTPVVLLNTPLLVLCIAYYVLCSLVLQMLANHIALVSVARHTCAWSETLIWSAVFIFYFY